MQFYSFRNHKLKTKYLNFKNCSVINKIYLLVQIYVSFNISKNELNIQDIFVENSKTKYLALSLQLTNYFNRYYIMIICYFPLIFLTKLVQQNSEFWKLRYTIIYFLIFVLEIIPLNYHCNIKLIC